MSITWNLKGDIISSDPVMTTTMIGQQTSILIISSVDYQHSGQYTCRAENKAGQATYSAELRVNGKSGTDTGNISLQSRQLLFHSPSGSTLSTRASLSN